MSKKITSIVLVALMAAALFAVPAAAAEPEALKTWDFTQESSMSTNQLAADKIELVDGTLKFVRPAGNNAASINAKLAGTNLIEGGKSYRLNFKFKTDANQNARPYVTIDLYNANKETNTAGTEIAPYLKIAYKTSKVDYYYYTLFNGGANHGTAQAGVGTTQSGVVTFEKVTDGDWKEYTLYFSVPSNFAGASKPYSYIYLGQNETYTGTGSETSSEKSALYCKTPVYYKDVALYEDYNEVKIDGDKMKVHLKGACAEAEYNALTTGKQLISAVYEGTTPVLKSISVPTLANTDFAREFVYNANKNTTGTVTATNKYYTALDYVVDLPQGVQVGDTVKLMLLGNNNLGALAPMASVTITE